MEKTKIKHYLKGNVLHIEHDEEKIAIVASAICSVSHRRGYLGIATERVQYGFSLNEMSFPDMMPTRVIDPSTEALYETVCAILERNGKEGE